MRERGESFLPQGWGDPQAALGWLLTGFLILFLTLIRQFGVFRWFGFWSGVLWVFWGFFPLNPLGREDSEFPYLCPPLGRKGSPNFPEK